MVTLCGLCAVAVSCSEESTSTPATDASADTTVIIDPTTADSASTSATEPTSPAAATDATDATDATEATDAGPVPAGEIDAFGAIAVAVATTPGTAIEIGRGNERGEAVWEVLVRRDDGTGIEHYVSIATGEVVAQDSESIPAIASTPPAVTIEQAITIAAEAEPGSELIEADLDTEDSRVVWEVVVRRRNGPEVEFYIDAATGEIVKHEVDD